MDIQNANQGLAGRSKLFWGGAILVVGLLGAATWWVYQPSYVALYKNASEADQAEILATLSQWQVPYRINAAEGVVEVPAADLANARMRMVEAGVPARVGVGFEIFDQADYGMSEFSQKINYQRALEGELARTVMSIAEVQSARVHLTFRKTSLYQPQEEKPKASVVVRLRSGEELDASRVRGIQQLVASAVEGMEQEHVVVLDENGRLLSVGDAVLAVPDHLRMAEQMEAELQGKAQQLLVGPLGKAGAKVSVRVQLNFDRVKSVKELPLLPGGKNAVQRERQVNSNESSSGDTSSKRAQTTRETDFVLGKERAEVEHATGRVERISVGVVLAEALPAQGVKEIRELLEAALGLDAERGDRIVIAHIPSRVPLEAGGDELEPAAPAQVSEPPRVQASPESGKDSSLFGLSRTALIALLLAAVALAFLPLLLRRRRAVVQVQQPRLSSVEREQLLHDLRRWLQDGR
ncbi:MULTISPECIES: flagellar basal-body MS-ring/collar protein FliF [unclassified Pseudomonas]|uniref:flagellar basal-body MS-ring/collar protein FliF n=1 Tax=unclassified Pseudomonas TaxID=196821 RepID=UPI00244D522B|nr:MULTISPECIES: flagellar basal-body MS-ring/collar protein FliF [unclassified Pseudomonas]MDG9930385.1 flagellar basal-body MS-ring/collar protein FliF [Pseudomonas sp. GD04042]MDH0484502.1 flagellar basal-body MS-ring/collar protein FliF [Pseudomonas sp. GD04015]MDH0606040.1 flagellar basal-body MS-ring/collar protein FliF [Pseudomonas sp. GD03869]